MRLLHAAEVHSCTYKEKGCLHRFTVGRHFDYQDAEGMSFMRPRFNGTRFQILDIPRRYRPSIELTEYLASILEIDVYLPIVTPYGAYYGHDYHTDASDKFDTRALMVGRKISEITLEGEQTYDLVCFGSGNEKRAYFAQHAATQTNGELLWRILPTPEVVATDKAVLETIIGHADQHAADFTQAVATWH